MESTQAKKLLEEANDDLSYVLEKCSNGGLAVDESQDWENGETWFLLPDNSAVRVTSDEAEEVTEEEFHAASKRHAGILDDSGVAIDFDGGVEIVFGEVDENGEGETEGNGTVEDYTGERTVEALRATLQDKRYHGDVWAYARPLGKFMAWDRYKL